MAVGGKDSTLKHGTQAAPQVLTDYTSKVISASPDFGGDYDDATTWGTKYREKEATFKDAKMSVTYKSDEDIFIVVSAIYSEDTEIDFELSPMGTEAGKPKVTGKMILPNFSAALESGTVQKLDVSYEINGAVTFGVHA